MVQASPISWDPLLYNSLGSTSHFGTMASQGLLIGAPALQYTGRSQCLSGTVVQDATTPRASPLSCIENQHYSGGAASSGCSLTSWDHGCSRLYANPGKTCLQAGASEEWGIPFIDSLYFSVGSSLSDKFVFLQNGPFNEWGLALRISFLLSRYKAEWFFLMVIASFSAGSLVS